MSTPTLLLEPRDHEHFLTHGYVLVRGALPARTVRAAVEHLEQVIADLDLGLATGIGDAGGQESADPRVWALARGATAQAVAELSGPWSPCTPRLNDIHSKRHVPDVDWLYQPLHLDDDFPLATPCDSALGTFVFLTPSRPGAGNMVGIPGSHLDVRRRMSSDLDALYAKPNLGEMLPDARELLTSPGDVLITTHLFVHMGTHNVSAPELHRHMVHFDWIPGQRLHTRSGPPRQMSTLEKVNSARYLAQRNRISFAYPHAPPLAGAGTLSRGLALEAGIRTHAVLQFGGKLRLLAVGAGDPTRVRTLHASDFVDWAEDAAFEPGALLGTPGREILSLQRATNHGCIQLTVGLAGAGVALLRSADARRWELLAVLEEARAAQFHYHGFVHSYREVLEKELPKYALFLVDADGSRCVRRWAGPGSDLRRWSEPELVCTAPPGGHLEGLSFGPVEAEQRFALVFDVRHPGAGVVPYFVLTGEDVRIHRPLRRLAVSTATAPRSLRVLARASGLWLLSYLRDVEGRARLFWGVLDWHEPEPRLVELSTPRELGRVLTLCGLD